MKLISLYLKISAVARVRNALAFAIHRFFQERGFYYVHTPLITASDCEGAGEMFSVTTLLNGIHSLKDVPRAPNVRQLFCCSNMNLDRFARLLEGFLCKSCFPYCIRSA